MKARIPSHREFIINFPDSVDQAKANEGWAKLQQIVEDYKKAHNGASVYAPTFIEDCEPAVKKLQEEYGFEYTVEYVKLIFPEDSNKMRTAAAWSFPCGGLFLPGGTRSAGPQLFESTRLCESDICAKRKPPVYLYTSRFFHGRGWITQAALY